MRLIDADALLAHYSQHPDQWYIGNAVIESICDAPTMMDGPRNKMERRILRVYQAAYDEACQRSEIINPAAWALYQVWKVYDGERHRSKIDKGESE